MLDIFEEVRGYLRSIFYAPSSIPGIEVRLPRQLHIKSEQLLERLLVASQPKTNTYIPPFVGNNPSIAQMYEDHEFRKGKYKHRHVSRGGYDKL